MSDSLSEKHKHLADSMRMGSCFPSWEKCNDCKICLVSKECKEATENRKSEQEPIEENQDVDAVNGLVSELDASNELFSVMGQEFAVGSVVEGQKATKYDFERNGSSVSIIVAKSGAIQFKVDGNVVDQVKELKKEAIGVIVEKIMAEADAD
jgi:hypothetical protein